MKVALGISKAALVIFLLVMIIGGIVHAASSAPTTHAPTAPAVVSSDDCWGQIAYAAKQQYLGKPYTVPTCSTRP